MRNIFPTTLRTEIKIPLMVRLGSTTPNIEIKILQIVRLSCYTPWVNMLDRSIPINGIADKRLAITVAP